MGKDIAHVDKDENCIPVEELRDLGERDEMKAIGLFEHEGVATHPRNLGMEKISDIIS